MKYKMQILQDSLIYMLRFIKSSRSTNSGRNILLLLISWWSINYLSMPFDHNITSCYSSSSHTIQWEQQDERLSDRNISCYFSATGKICYLPSQSSIASLFAFSQQVGCLGICKMELSSSYKIYMSKNCLQIHQAYICLSANLGRIEGFLSGVISPKCSGLCKHIQVMEWCVVFFFLWLLTFLF